MKFTYDAYKELLLLLKKYGYKDCSYYDWDRQEKTVILRHDIDTSLEAALEFSKIEKELDMQATYFVLLNTDFYNVASTKSKKIIYEIQKNGGTIGLHFDETGYADANIIEAIQKEAKNLENILEIPITSVSMHRPSEKTLNADLKIEGIVNSYSKIFFKKFKYVSDSRRNWRENVEEIIKSEVYDKLHILTHAFWYHEEECTAKQTLKSFINKRKEETYQSLADNIRNIEEFLKLSEVDDTL